MDKPMPDWIVPSWQNFLASNPQADDLIYLDLFRRDLMPLQRSCELRRMLKWLQKQRPAPKVLMEIGTDRGSTFYHWLKTFPTLRKVIACEIRGTPFRNEFEKAFPQLQFCWLEASSYAAESVAKVQLFLGPDPIDILFLDGDKSFFGRDFDLYLPNVDSGGVIMFHDVFDNGSPMQNDFLERAKRFTHCEVIIDTSECDAIKQQMLAGKLTDPLTNYQRWLQIWLHTSCGFGVIVKD